MTITLTPTTQKDIDSWIRYGSSIVRRRTGKNVVDESSVLAAIYDLSTQYVGEPEFFYRFVSQQIVWKYTRATIKDRPAYTIETSFTSAYHKAHPDKPNDVDAFIAFMKERYKRPVSKELATVLINHATPVSLDSVDIAHEDKHELDVAALFTHIDLFLSFYQSMEGCANYIKSFFHSEMTYKHQPTRTQLQTLLVFLYNQLPYDDFMQFKKTVCRL